MTIYTILLSKISYIFSKSLNFTISSFFEAIKTVLQLTDYIYFSKHKSNISCLAFSFIFELSIFKAIFVKIGNKPNLLEA